MSWGGKGAIEGGRRGYLQAGLFLGTLRIGNRVKLIRMGMMREGGVVKR